ncbi:heterokaryon incompatibility protein-domain-containing protein [Lenzites betulinus]|nr:heterokaryon incompatibility protein-domain-containing protein [Lenzites betulinus]
MPRFLDTHTGHFVWIDDPKKCSYVILSHTWRPVSAGGEQSYEDLRKLQAEVAIPPSTSTFGRFKQNGTQDSVLSHPQLSAKVKGICRIAREAGYDLVWIDSCCIDKSSSAELSEAINSMYEWYRLAAVCYAYLEDVPDGASTDSLFFSQSRWYTRGWTLQELIAPKHIIFLSFAWGFLGTKMSLAATLEQLTGVDFALLTERAQLDSFSVARRMSWAARRRTTRVEDEAYCLMGIFNIHMTPIYGEGRQAAFTRLQEEVIKTIPDQSIFSWGRCSLLSDTNHARNLSAAWQALPYETGLIAHAPADFEFSVDDVPLLPVDFAARIGMSESDLPPLHCTFTPQGVRIQCLCIALSAIPQGIAALATLNKPYALCDACEEMPPCHILALLQCENLTDGTLVTLPMCHPSVGVGEPAGLIVSTHSTCGWEGHAAFRVVRLAPAFLRDNDVRNSIATQEVFVRISSAPPADDSPPPSLDPTFSVSFDPSCLEDLRTLGFSASPLRVEGLPGQEAPTLLEHGSKLKLSLATTLSCSHRPFPQRLDQLIEVQIDLSVDFALGSLAPLARLRLLGHFPVVRFSVRHFFDAPPLATLDHAGNPSGPLEWDALDPRDGMREAPFADGGPGTLLLSWVDNEDLPGTVDRLRNSIEAEFVIYAEAENISREPGDSAFDIRLLRVALYTNGEPMPDFGGSNGLRLRVQLTEPYPYKMMLDGGRGTRIGHLADASEEALTEVSAPLNDSTFSRVSSNDDVPAEQHQTLESSSSAGLNNHADVESVTSKLPSLPFYLMQVDSVSSLLMTSNCSLSALGWSAPGRTFALQRGTPLHPAASLLRCLHLASYRAFRPDIVAVIRSRPAKHTSGSISSCQKNIQLGYDATEWEVTGCC